MKKILQNRILARIEPGDFVGRSDAVERLIRHGTTSGHTNGLVLLSTPSAGTSELLRHVYDRLFVEQEDVIPFYFEVRASDGTAKNAANRFVADFLRQTVAFRRRDPRIIDAAADPVEVAELALPSDGHWVDRLTETLRNEVSSDDRSFVRNCLSAPFRAAAMGAQPFLLIDSLNETALLEDSGSFLNDLLDIFSRASIPFVLAGHRRFLFARSPFFTLPVDTFAFGDAGKFVETHAASHGVAINAQTRDLIAVQLGGNASHIRSLFASAADSKTDLNTFELVERVYTDEVYGGRIARHYDAIFAAIVPSSDSQTRVLRLLIENLSASDHRIPLTFWTKHSGLADVDLKTILDSLHHHEIVNMTSASVEIDPTNIVLCDYLWGRKQLEIDGTVRALAVGEALGENFRRAPQLMARFYRRNSAIRLRPLLRAFDGRQVPLELIDYDKFKSEVKGLSDEEILVAVSKGESKLELPKIVFAAYTAAFYPKLNDICDTERSALAYGFGNHSGKEKTAWIAAEVDSKLEASADVAEFWCDRLEMVAVNCDLANYKLWLIAPEGFSSEAIEVLRRRNAFGSSRKQVDLLAKFLNTDSVYTKSGAGREFEIVIPMGEDTEMLAAHTIEEIARRNGVPAKTINQVKTALVEACINATEHSLSPDQRIHQKFVFEPEKIIITVSNRGVRLGDAVADEDASAKNRRGWGLKLIKGLMDDVVIEHTDDGTSIRMIKYFERPNVNPEKAADSST